MRARDNRGRYTPSPARTLARQLKQIALLRSQPECVQNVRGEYRWCPWTFGLEDEAA